MYKVNQAEPYKNTKQIRQTILAIDDVSLPLRKNVGLLIKKPTVYPCAVLAPSPLESGAPDNICAHFYGTVMYDQGKYRMWYYASHRGMNPDWPPRMKQQLAKTESSIDSAIKSGSGNIYQGPVCYAESKDGINWVKPALHQVLFKGSYENNAVALPHTITCGAAVIRDDDDPDPKRRYKMVYQYFPDQSEPPIEEYGSLPSAACAVSADGLKWTVTVLPFVDQFVEHCSFIKHDGRYILHSQVFPGTDWSNVYFNGGMGGRIGIAHSTEDFDRWPDFWEPAFALTEPGDPTKRGSYKKYDQVHLGVGAMTLDNVCVGVYGLWHDDPTFGNISCDLGLVISNDGIHFREPAPGHVFINREESPVTPVPGKSFPTILCQGNGILNVEDETRIYHGRWRNAEDEPAYCSAEVGLATIPRDRWGSISLNTGMDTGQVCSAPVTLPSNGCELYTNADGVTAISVELLDEQYSPIEGFGNGYIAGGDGLCSPVRWDGHDLKELAGKKVRILVRLGRQNKIVPELYAIYIE